MQRLPREPLRSDRVSGRALLVVLGVASATVGALADPLPDAAEVHDPLQARDARGMSLLRETLRRSPSGLRYAPPPAPRRWQALGEGWRARGALEFGVFFDGGDERETRFEKYTERDDEAYLNALRLELERPEQGLYARLRSASTGRDDAAHSLELGRYGHARLRGWFSRIPHRFASDARVLWDGAGGDLLRLPAGLTPGAGSPDEVAAARAALGEREIALRRDRSGLALDWRLLPELRLRGGWSLEDRRGARPFGGGYSFPPASNGGSTLETIEGIDDRTQRVHAALEWSGERMQANLGYRGSFYRNRNPALTFENPFRVGSPGRPLLEQGRFALAPGNQAHDLQVDFAAPLPFWQARVHAGYGRGWWLQDEDLLPPTINDVTLGFGALAIDLDEWNTTRALSQPRANARIDVQRVDLGLSFAPLRRLRVKLRYRYDDEKNDTRYTAFNPQNGAYGYIVEDGGRGLAGPAQAGVFQPLLVNSQWRIRNTPYGRDVVRWDVDGSLRITTRTRLRLHYRREEIDRDFRERRETREDSARIELSARELSWLTLRAYWEGATRAGGAYDPEVLRPFFSSSLPEFRSNAAGPPPLVFAGLERADVSNRDRQTTGLRVGVPIGERGELFVEARYRSDDHRVDFGLESVRSARLNAEWSWQFGPATTGFLYGSWERARRETGHVRGQPGIVPWPEANAWELDDELRHVALGAGLHWQLAPGLELRSDYRFGATRQRVDYSFSSAAALADGAPPGATPDAFPSSRFREHAVETSLRWQLNERLALRFEHRFVRSTLDDYRQTGPAGIGGQRLFLGHVDGDYQASLWGAALQLRF